MSLTPMTFVEASKGPGIDGIENSFLFFALYFWLLQLYVFLCIAMSGLFDHLHSPFYDLRILICLTVTTSDKPMGTKLIKVWHLSSRERRCGIFHVITTPGDNGYLF